jgi:CelD/BcsL family acetyltransferase involved in cellulose biosynthesis
MTIGDHGDAAAAALCLPTAPASLEVTFARAAERLEPLRAEWQSLAACASEPNSFSEWWFVAASVRHLADDSVRLAEVRQGTRLIGVLPLVIERHYGRVPVRYVQNWRHHHQFLGAPLVQEGKEEDFWRALLGALDGAAWAPGFLHLRDLPEDGRLHMALITSAAAMGRPAPTVYRETRAFLQTSLSPDDYYSQTVRKKKRKELARLRNRLAELGSLTTRRFSAGDSLSAWCDAYLKLEQSGWKGQEGSALACRAATSGFFRDALTGADERGHLQLLALELDGQPIAMLVNFLAAPGSFSFKTAFDEAYARFSPGVLLQIDNLAILEQPGIEWMDSCAAEQHPMIESLWAERRSLIRVTIPLRGAQRRLAFSTARTLERLSAARRRGRPAPPVDGDCE